MSSDQLIPINQIAKLAGTDKIHLAYLTKLRLIPQTIRRKIGNKITGCYPENVISLIPKIEELKNMGLTYSQIKFEMQKPVQHDTSFQYSHSNSLAFLVIGLVLGYILFALNGINNSNTNTSLAVKNVQAAEVPQDQPIYLLAIPNKNLYKLGQMDLTSLLK